MLAGLSIPIESWRQCEKDIDSVKSKYRLQSTEIHTGWLIRNYTEQNKIKDFENLDYDRRKFEVEKYRKTELLKLQKSPNHKLYKQTKKNFEKTRDYIHLTKHQRSGFIEEIAKTIRGWKFSRLFAECIDKIHFDPSRANKGINEQAFEQLVSRFEQYLNITKKGRSINYGLLIHDNNETVAKKHTELMKAFHKKGTFWTSIKNIIETPLFVNSELTGMVQLADVCAYSLRRYLENRDETLFDHVFERADRKNQIVVGIRHFTDESCVCKICAYHRAKSL